MKFLANENIPLTSVETLRGGGSDVLAIAETSPGLADRDVLRTAVEESRIILTFDRDYGELIFRRELPRPPGVVLFRFTPESPGEPAELMKEILGDDEIGLIGMFTVAEKTAVRQRPIDSSG